MSRPAERELKTVRLKVTIEVSGEEPRELEIGYPINLKEVGHASAIVASRVSELLDVALTTTRKTV